VVTWTSAALDGAADPADDAGWKAWLAIGWDEAWRDDAIARCAPGSTMRLNADFLAEHWKPVSDETCACDMYDRDARLCMAQESKPPVCSDYPWYGREPHDGVNFPLQCSYLADLPRDQRPEGARPLIPLAVVSREPAPA
jgi:hypothetical protein